MAKFWFWSYWPKCGWSIKLQDSFKCNAWRKKWIMKCIFVMQMNTEVFYRLILSFWVCIARHAQSTQNKKFAYLCNISRKTWGFDFFCLQINKSFWQVDSISFIWVCWARHAERTQNNGFAISLQYLKGKTWRRKLIFCLQINIKGFIKLMLFQVCVARDVQITQNKKFAIFKFAISEEKSEWWS